MREFIETTGLSHVRGNRRWDIDVECVGCHNNCISWGIFCSHNERVQFPTYVTWEVTGKGFAFIAVICAGEPQQDSPIIVLGVESRRGSFRSASQGVASVLSETRAR